MSQKALTQVLRRLPRDTDPRLLVGTATADDAGVYRLDRDRALVQTVDFFTPVVDDPFVYGQIAAVNALSDVYAMGGRPLTALNLLGIPTDRVPPEVINAILRGGAAKLGEARCVLAGGHTIRNPEPIYGLSVTGLVSPRHLMTNTRARPGDQLVLTKPLGSGIISTAIKQGRASGGAVRAAVRVMRTLNSVGAELAERGLVRAATDITGYGLLGHLAVLCRASRVGAELDASRVPLIHRDVLPLIGKGCVPGGTRQNLDTAAGFTTWKGVGDTLRHLLADAQTSGGLLLCVAPRRLGAVLALLRRRRTPCAAVVGRVVRSREPVIEVQG